MSGNVTTPNTFQNQTGPIPLAQLDANFAAAVTAINAFTSYGNFLADSGAANALVVTTTGSSTFAYTTGTPLQVLVAATSTSTTPTINVNGLGAKTIVNSDGTALVTGALLAANIVALMYDGTNFRITGEVGISGTFTGTLTDGGVDATGTVKYTRVRNMVMMNLPGGTIITAANTSLAMTGVPTFLRPPNGVNVSIGNFLMQDNSTLVGDVAAQVNTSGGIIFFKAGGPSGWSSTGNKGIPGVQLNITYLMA